MTLRPVQPHYVWGKLSSKLRNESNSTLRDSNCAQMLHPNIRKNILPVSSLLLFVLKVSYFQVPEKAVSKGQLISKGNFSVFNSPPNKRNLKMLIFALDYWGRKFLFVLGGELKKQKSPFEINWPLSSMYHHLLGSTSLFNALTKVLLTDKNLFPFFNL